MDRLEYLTKNTTFETNVWLVASHHGDYQDGVAAGAYYGSVNGNGLSGTFWGSGGVKNTETLFAYGIAHVVQIALAEDHEPLFPLHIFIHNNGVRAYLKDYVPRWISNGGLNSRGGKPDAFDAWKGVYLLNMQASIIVDQVTPSTFRDDSATFKIDATDLPRRRLIEGRIGRWTFSKSFKIIPLRSQGFDQFALRHPRMHPSNGAGFGQGPRFASLPLPRST